MSDTPLIEAIARALSNAKGLSPDALYQHNDYEDWPEDHRNEYICSITDNRIVQVFHRAWRRHEAAAQAALTAITEAGFVCVPREPTEAMIEAGINIAVECTDNWTAAGSCIAEHIWPAMISAAQGDGA